MGENNIVMQLIDYLGRNSSPGFPVARDTVSSMGRVDQLDPIINYYKDSGSDIAEGAGQTLMGPNRVRGFNKAIGGIGRAAAPLAIPAAMSNPMSVLTSILMSGAADSAIKRGSDSLGLSKDNSDLASTLASSLFLGGRKMPKHHSFEEKMLIPEGLSRIKLLSNIWKDRRSNLRPEAKFKNKYDMGHRPEILNTDNYNPPGVSYGNKRFINPEKAHRVDSQMRDWEKNLQKTGTKGQREDIEELFRIFNQN